MIKSGGNVFDLDSTLGLDCSFKYYNSYSFKEYESHYYGKRLFRVIESKDYIHFFSSDRSHMIKNGNYIKPPPSWSLILPGNHSLQ